jgi:hypothetical protein
MGRSVVKISSITKETLQNYKNILQRELNISAPNTVAMALSRATPIFGYFAAKFMETGVFRKFSDAIKNKLSDAANVVGNKFKSIFRAGEHSRRDTRIPKLQKGGYVAKTGLAQVHAAEVVVPVQKLFREFNTMFRKSFRPMLGELGAIREQLAMISEPTDEEGPFGIYGMMRSMFREVPVFKTFVKVADWMSKPLKWLFSTQSKYKAKVPKGVNVLGNIATTLGMIYADFMHKFDHILSSLKAIGVGLGVSKERFKEPRQAMEITGIQQIRIAARKVRQWVRGVKPTGWESPSVKAKREKDEKRKEEALIEQYEFLKERKKLEKGMTQEKFLKAKKAEGGPLGEMGGGGFSNLVQYLWETMLGFAGLSGEEARRGGVGGLGVLTPKNITRTIFGGTRAGIEGPRKAGKLTPVVPGKIEETRAAVLRRKGTTEEISKEVSIEEIKGKASKFIVTVFKSYIQDPSKKMLKIVEKIGMDVTKILEKLKDSGRKISDYLIMGIGVVSGWIKRIMAALSPLRFLRSLGGLGLKGLGGLGKAGGALLRMLPMGAAVGAAAFGVYEMIQAFRGEKTIVGEMFGTFGEWITGGKYKGPGWLGDLVFDIVESASKTISKSIDSVVGYVKEKAAAVVDLVLYPFNFMWDLAVKVKDWIVEKIKDDPLVKQVMKAGGAVKTGVKAAGGAVVSGAKKVTEAAKYAGGAVVGGITTAGEKIGSMIGIKKMPDVDITGVQEPVWKNFSLMAEEYKKETGKDIQLNSAYRSPAKQAELYRTNPKIAAPPGKSMHGKGLALDINSGDAYGLKKEGLMEKYGFYQPMGNEPWHLQMKPQVGGPNQFNVPYRRKDLVNGEVESAMFGINGMSQALNPMVGAIDKGLKGMNTAIISTSNVITSMQSNQQNGGGRQSGQGSFDPEIAAILSGNI